VKPAARLAELNPDHTGPARSGLGATARSIFGVMPRIDQKMSTILEAT
jgi:hypothetical protein